MLKRDMLLTYHVIFSQTVRIEQHSPFTYTTDYVILAENV